MSTPPPDLFIVAGMSPLGQHCARVLKQTFGVVVHAVGTRTEQESAARLERDHILDRTVCGDPRDRTVLERAGIAQCRAILLVDPDERINVAAAFAARALNPAVRLVLASAQTNLNKLLARSLGNLVAYEPTELSASAFALAGLEGETTGLVRIGDEFLTVYRRTLTADSAWCDGRRLHDINTRSRRILTHDPADEPGPGGFHRWAAGRAAAAGDSITWIQRNAPYRHDVPPAEGPRRGPADNGNDAPRAAHGPLSGRLMATWRTASPAQRAIIALGGVLALLYVLGALLFRIARPDLGTASVFNVAMVLILGGYPDLFGDFTPDAPVAVWLQLYSLLLTVAGTAFIGVVYAALTAQILGARFTFLQKRPPPPPERHVVVVGLNEVGRRVASLLTELKQPVVGIHDGDPPPGIPPSLPLVTGPLGRAATRAHLTTARTVIAMTGDEVANLEIALTARAANPDCRLVIRTDDAGFGRDLAALVPGAQAFGTFTLAAEAFAGAAFGENILDVFHVGGDAVLVTEYRVDEGDTLNGRLLADVAYGYGVVPICLQRPGREAETLPSDDERLHVGDRLIVLATTEGLHRVEAGQQRPRTTRLWVDRTLNEQAVFHGAMTVARIAGCDPGTAREFMAHVPGALALPLFDAQAHRLVGELGKRGVRARAVPTDDAG